MIIPPWQMNSLIILGLSDGKEKDKPINPKHVEELMKALVNAAIEYKR
jgi:hypothetical protein